MDTFSRHSILRAERRIIQSSFCSQNDVYTKNLVLFLKCSKPFDSFHSPASVVSKIIYIDTHVTFTGSALFHEIPRLIDTSGHTSCISIIFLPLRKTYGSAVSVSAKPCSHLEALGKNLLPGLFGLLQNSFPRSTSNHF